MERISDDLLRSILIRLPNIKSVIPCGLVSKRWHSLLTDPRFILAFISHVDRRDPYSSRITFLIETSTIVPSHYDMCYEWQFHRALYARPRFLELGTFPVYNRSCYYNRLTQLPPSFLSFLPGPTLRVRASYMHLLLVSSSPVHYYICIPNTRYWLPLPEAPKAARAPAAYGMVGRSGSQQYVVVLFHTCRVTADGSQYQYLVSVFSPETRGWTKHVSTSWPMLALGADPDFRTESRDCRVVSDCNRGVLYWQNNTPDGFTAVLRFDPYEEESSNRRWGLSRFTEKMFIGNCLGKLNICFLYFKEPRTFCFEAYELEDQTRLTHNSGWNLVHRSPILQLGSQELNILEVSFHPLDQRVIFFYDVNVLLLYNMSFESLDIVGQMPATVDPATQQLSVFTVVNNT